MLTHWMYAQGELFPHSEALSATNILWNTEQMVQIVATKDYGRAGPELKV